MNRPLSAATFAALCVALLYTSCTLGDGTGQAQFSENAVPVSSGSDGRNGEGTSSTMGTTSPSGSGAVSGAVDGSLMTPELYPPAPNQNSLPFLNPSQPNSSIPDAIWIAQPGLKTELYAETGPVDKDVIQGLNNDCIVFALLSAIVSISPQRITKMIRLAGKTDDGLNVYAVTLYNLSGGSKEILIDERINTRVIEKGEQTLYEYSYDSLKIDQQNDSVVLWPVLIQKALAVHFGGYELFPAITSGITPILTGRFACALMNSRGGIEDIGSPPFLLTKYLNLRTAVTVDSRVLVQSHANDSIDLRVSQQGQYNCVDIEGSAFCLVQNHEYEVKSFDGNYIALRNPWGENIGSGVSGDGVVTVPMAAYTALTDVTWAEGRLIDANALR